MFTSTYPFSKDVAEETLFFVVACTVVFCIGYWLSQLTLVKTSKCSALLLDDINFNFKLLTKLIVFFLSLQIFSGIYVLSVSGMSYVAISEAKRSLNFVFELRMLPMLLLSFVALNVHPKEWLYKKELKIVRYILVVYILLAVMLQARSVVFELVSILVFCWLLWHGNRVRIKYIAVLGVALTVPNILVLFRFTGSGLLDFDYVVANLFTIEYSVIFTNIVSGAIVSNIDPLWGGTFIQNLVLVVPSPIRAVFGMGNGSNEIYATIGQEAGVYGGGFSLFAEMYLNFRWWSIPIFTLFGLLIGKVIRSAANGIGRASLFNAAAPLIYVAFVLLLRNDLGVFIKYVIQVLIFCLILTPIIKKRFFNDFVR